VFLEIPKLFFLHFLEFGLPLSRLPILELLDSSSFFIRGFPFERFIELLPLLNLSGFKFFSFILVSFPNALADSLTPYLPAIFPAFCKNNIGWKQQ